MLIAKLAMVEIAGGFGYEQANASLTGPGLNPWDITRWAGGSSSGSGAAVAGGLVPFAIGSETWGSIVTPAGYCGVTGFRPTYDRVPRTGAMALSWTLDKLGPMARTAADCQTVLDAIEDPQPPSVSEPNAPLRLVRFENDTRRLQPEVKANYEAVVEQFETLTDRPIETTRLPELPYSLAAATLVDCELAAGFGDIIRSGDVWELTAPEDRSGGYAPSLISAVDYIAALRIRGKAQRALAEWSRGFDALVSPNLATVAIDAVRPFRESVRGFGFTNTSIGGAANLAGLPGVCLPMGPGENDLPTSLLLTAGPHRDRELLAIAAKYQSQTGHHRRHPDLEATTLAETIPAEAIGAADNSH